MAVSVKKDCWDPETFNHSPLNKKREENWTQNLSPNCFWNRYWARASQLLVHCFSCPQEQSQKSLQKLTWPSFPLVSKEVNGNVTMHFSLSCTDCKIIHLYYSFCLRGPNFLHVIDNKIRCCYFHVSQEPMDRPTASLLRCDIVRNYIR